MIRPDIQMSALQSGDLAEAKGLSDALNWPYRLEDWAFSHSLGEGLALRDGTRLIGTGMGWTYGPRFATVWMIIVDAAYQGLGLGSRLVDGPPRVNTEEAMVRGTLPETSTQAHIFALCSNSLG